MVDHCNAVSINETLDVSITDRSPCEMTASTSGVNHLINVYTPLELGGRARPGVDVPAGVIGNSFDGCIRNLWINGQVSDITNDYMG